MSMYCDANNDVRRLTGYQSAYSTSSTPMLTDVNDIIIMLSGEVDGYLNAGGIKSISNSYNTNILKTYVSLGAAGRVMSRWFQNPNDKEQGFVYWTEFKEWLDKLVRDPQYINVFIQNEGLANEAKQLGNAVTQGFSPYTSAINAGLGTYINERFTY